MGARSIESRSKRKTSRSCRENLRLIAEGKLRVYNIFTGDESWIYHRKIESRQSSSKGQGQKPKLVVKRNQFEPKSMFSIFFRTTGVVHIDCASKGATIDNQYYIENCLKPSIAA